jgi:hypothetical protein
LTGSGIPPGRTGARLKRRVLRRQLLTDMAHRGARFRPQPYGQLASALRAQGLDADAKAVLIGMALDRRKWGGLRSRAWQWVLWATIRNGYQPIPAGISLLVV